jgi:hypothetical protein
MRQQTINDGRSYEGANIRQARVRRMTFWSTVVLCLLCLSAVWQDRALAPALHDGMQGAADTAMRYALENETLAAALTELQQEYARRFGES